MIIESKPLHKKKKRLAKQNSKRGELSRQASVVRTLIVFCMNNQTVTQIEDRVI